MKDHQKHLDAFDAHLTLKNFSKATRTAYGGALRQFLVYRLEQGAIDIKAIHFAKINNNTALYKNSNTELIQNFV